MPYSFVGRSSPHIRLDMFNFSVCFSCLPSPTLVFFCCREAFIVNVFLSKLRFFFVFVSVDDWTDATEPGQSVVLPHLWSAKTLTCCRRQSPYRRFLLLCLSHRDLLTAPFLFSSWPRGGRQYFGTLCIGLFLVVLVCKRWLVWFFPPHCHVLAPPECWVFLLLFFFASLRFISAQLCFVPSVRHVFPVTSIFGHRFCAPVEHMLERFACKTIASDYLRLSNVVCMPSDMIGCYIITILTAHLTFRLYAIVLLE